MGFENYNHQQIKNLQEILGIFTFLNEFIYSTQLYFTPFYDILRQQNNFESTIEHQKRFYEIEKLKN